MCLPQETLNASGAQGLDWEWLERREGDAAITNNTHRNEEVTYECTVIYNAAAGDPAAGQAGGGPPPPPGSAVPGGSPALRAGVDPVVRTPDQHPRAIQAAINLRHSSQLGGRGSQRSPCGTYTSRGPMCNRCPRGKRVGVRGAGGGGAGSVRVRGAS